MTESESVSHSVVSDFLLLQGILRQEYWSELPSSSRDLPDPGIEPASPALQADSLLTDPWGKQLLICISLMTNEVGHFY